MSTRKILWKYSTARNDFILKKKVSMKDKYNLPCMKCPFGTDETDIEACATCNDLQGYIFDNLRKSYKGFQDKLMCPLDNSLIMYEVVHDLGDKLMFDILGNNLGDMFYAMYFVEGPSTITRFCFYSDGSNVKLENVNPLTNEKHTICFRKLRSDITREDFMVMLRERKGMVLPCQI